MKKYGIYICFAILAAAMAAVFPREGKFQYSYQIGHPWLYETLTAPIDFPLLKTEEEMLAEMDEKAGDVVDLYRYDDAVGPAMVERFNRAAIEQGVDPSLRRFWAEALTDAYRAGVVSGFGDEDVSGKVIFIQRDRHAEETPAADVYTVDYVYNSILYEAGSEHPSIDVDSVANVVNLKSFIAPDLVFDESATAMMHREAVNYISPSRGMIYAGQLIVSKGELITADICQMLDSFKVEYQQSFGYTGSRGGMFAEHLIFVLLLVLLLAVTLIFTDSVVLQHLNESVFFMLLLFCSFTGTSILCQVNQKLLFLFPYALFITIASAFFRRNIVFPTYLVSLLPVLILPDNGAELFLVHLAAGAVAMSAFSRFNRGWSQFVVALLIYAAMQIVKIAFDLSSARFSTSGFFSGESVYIAVSSFLVIVLYPLVFLFEKLFSFVSYARLRDLADTNNRLLQDLQRKAPGTFQHSLQVANMAEFAARRIGADPMLIRVGSLYHDIGKGENPMCFVENQQEGSEYHRHITPEESARLIIRHVEDGMTLARRGGLPDAVSDFIITHHGTTLVSYFYNVYCNNGGNPDNKAPFTYPGRCPETKEQVILMMADSVEAASRTLKDFSDRSISDLVDRILAGKMTGEQLVGADISLKEVEIVKDAFKDFLKQSHHSRISYPKLKQTSAK